MKNKLSILLAVVVALVGINLSTAQEKQVDPVSYENLQAKTHWLTTSSGIRHNSSCRWFKNSKGRMCTKSEGRACKKCGG